EVGLLGHRQACGRYAACYRYGNSPAAEQTVPAGSARLRLQPPAGVECLPRPYSYIGLVGSFTTSPEHRPIPGSDGDICTKTSSAGLASAAARSLTVAASPSASRAFCLATAASAGTTEADSRL